MLDIYWSNRHNVVFRTVHWWSVWERLESRPSSRTSVFVRWILASHLLLCFRPRFCLHFHLRGLSKIFRTDAVKIINLTTKGVQKLPTSIQLLATWHTDSLDMVVLLSTGASCYHNCYIDDGTGPEYFGYTLVCLVGFKCHVHLIPWFYHPNIFWGYNILID
jgi:hypothetical protein